MTTLIGKRYEQQHTIGKGAMGVVHQVLDRLTQQTIALKQVYIKPDDDDSQHNATTATVALAREFQTLASLRHPHIITVLDYGFDDEQNPFFTMSLLQDPQTIVAYATALDRRAKIKLIIQMLQALAYLHRRDIIHRDLKPSNVLVDDTGMVKVLDFGLAFQQDAPAGTLAYMAPETLQRNDNSPASDLYAVGVMAFEILAGQHPYQLGNVQRLMHQVFYHHPNYNLIDLPVTPAPNTHPDQETNNLPDEGTVILPQGSQPLPQDDDFEQAQHDPPILEEQDDLKAIIARLMQKNPEDRYQDAYEVIEALSQVLGEAVPTESRAIRESFLQAAEFVGRDAEFKQLNVALKNTMKGRGSAWLIGGESGVGKTRLLSELRTVGLVLGAQVLQGRANSAKTGGLNFQLFRDVLRRLLLVTPANDMELGVLKHIIPDMDHLLGRYIEPATLLDGRANQQRLLVTIVELFRRQNDPTIIILEDLHLGSESIPILKRLVEITPELPLLVVGSYRTDERPDLHTTLRMMNHLHIEPFSRDMTAMLSESMLGSIGSQPSILNLIQQESEGNAFFMIEVVRALSEQAGRLQDIADMALPQHVFPDGIQQILHRRMERLPIDAHPMLRIAAVAGRELDFNILRKIDPVMNYAQWTSLCANVRILSYQEGVWRFTHDKLRDAILEGLAETEYPRLNRLVAQAIETAYPHDDQYVIVLARHWQAANDEKAADKYTIRAGELALQISKFHEALEFFEQAVAGEFAPLRARILLGETYYNLGNMAEASQILLQGLAEAIAQQKTQEHIQALFVLSRVMNAQGHYEDAYKYLTEASFLVRQLGDDQLLAKVMWALAENLWMQSRLDDARIYIEEALPLARSVNDLAIEFELTNTLGATYNTGTPEERKMAQRYFEQSHQLAQQLGDQMRAAMSLANQANVLMDNGDYELAAPMFEGVYNVFKEMGHQQYMCLSLLNLAEAELGLKQNNKALAHLQEGIILAKDLNAVPLILGLLAIHAKHYILSHVPTLGLRTIGLIEIRPETNGDTLAMCEKFKALTNMTPEDMEPHLAHGRTLTLETLVAELFPASDDTFLTG